MTSELRKRDLAYVDKMYADKNTRHEDHVLGYGQEDSPLRVCSPAYDRHRDKLEMILNKFFEKIEASINDNKIYSEQLRRHFIEYLSIRYYDEFKELFEYREDDE